MQDYGQPGAGAAPTTPAYGGPPLQPEPLGQQQPPPPGERHVPYQERPGWGGGSDEPAYGSPASTQVLTTPGMGVHRREEERFEEYGGGEHPAEIGKPLTSSKLPMLVIVFAILSIIMMSIALVTPWYEISTEVDSGWEHTRSITTYYFDGVESDLEKVSWDDDQLKDLDAIKGVYSTTQIMVILGLVFGILLLVGAIIAMVGKGNKLAIIFGLLAFIFCLFAPIIFAGMHPGAWKSDWEDLDWELEGPGPWDSFMDEDTLEDPGYGVREIKTTWGPSTGWYLAFMGIIFAMLGFLLALGLLKAQSKSLATQQAQPHAPGYGQQPQPPQQQHSCPNCGQPLTFEQLYQKWYCNQCDRYL
jgi:hypothetical protein